MLDLLIVDGMIVDGAGNPWYRADIGVENGRIAVIKPRLEAEARVRLVAQDRIVCPGFIDMHSHSDWWLLAEPGDAPKLRQGITTELLGQDGFSLAPVSTSGSDTLRRLIAGMDGDPGSPFTWTSFAEYLDALRQAKPSANAACLVGHGTIRIAAMGMESRAPTPSELTHMKTLVAESMEQGAVGLSTGLLYAPCYYARREEMIELARVAASHHGMLVVHLRSEGDWLLESIDEMLDIAGQSGVSLQISHFKVFGRQNWGASERALERLDIARREGIDVTFDQYPYIAGSTGLMAILPHWVNEGGTSETLERLRSPVTRKRIYDEIAADSSWENMLKTVGPDQMQISWVRSTANQWIEGKSISSAAACNHQDPIEFALDLLLQENLEVSMVNFSMSEEDLRRIMTHSLHMVSTDAILLGKPHPRAYGAYPRILARYVREERLLPLEQAVRKMTSLPAQRLRLVDRGVLREGAWADIVVFDPVTIQDRATFEDPVQFPVGIDYVIVNGVPTVTYDKFLQPRAGQVLLGAG
jgi:N-acyl-D-amino-acid deacylase